MPSCNMVANSDQQAMLNSVHYTSRELATRFDFRGVQASYK